MTRTRNFVSILYPESAVPNWRDILIDLAIPAFVSPLHDKDKTSDGLVKKPHYHIMLMFSSVKTLNQASEVFSQLGAIRPQVVRSLPSQARYFCHLDQPTKHLYSISDVEQYSGADYISTIHSTADRYADIKAIMSIVSEASSDYLYCELLEYLSLTDERLFRCAVDNSILFTTYLKSLEYKKRRTRRLSPKQGVCPPNS